MALDRDREGKRWPRHSDWRDVEAAFRAARDPEMVVTLPKLKFMEGPGCSEEESRPAGQASRTSKS